ncbi:MAG: cytidine deaminase [Clostridia bacterium]
MNHTDQTELCRMLEMAYEAMEHAYVPYSHFQVGACLKATSGQYYLGCNIENAAYTPTNCAERTAMFKAVYAGERDFDAIAIACSGKLAAFPCGVCRQVLCEFCAPEMLVYCGNKNREATLCTLGELLPHSFGQKDLL